MKALNRLTLVLAVALTGAGCGDDDSTPNPPATGLMDGGLVDAGHADASAPTIDGGALPCGSATQATATMCGGDHCLETPAQLKAEVKPTTTCKADAELDSFCSGPAPKGVVNLVGQCALSNLAKFNPSDNTAFKAGITDCTKPQLDPTFTSACLACFVDSAACAASNCLAQCATPTAPACDTCRIEKGCITSFYACSGLTNPLDALNMSK